MAGWLSYVWIHRFCSCTEDAQLISAKTSSPWSNRTTFPSPVEKISTCSWNSYFLKRSISYTKYIVELTQKSFHRFIGQSALVYDFFQTVNALVNLKINIELHAIHLHLRWGCCISQKTGISRALLSWCLLPWEDWTTWRSAKMTFDPQLFCEPSATPKPYCQLLKSTSRIFAKLSQIEGQIAPKIHTARLDKLNLIFIFPNNLSQNSSKKLSNQASWSFD